MHSRMSERHQVERIGWLRAAVLGANDGIISTASLLMGVAAAKASYADLLITGLAALVAGAMSMAAGEYISVSTQLDTEVAEIQKEKIELATDLPAELEELTGIYIKRGLDAALAKQVAIQLMAKDPLETHLRDELGLGKTLRARPIQAALFSSAGFSLGAILPVLVAIGMPRHYVIPMIFVMAIVCLGILGGVAAKLGAADVRKGIWRVTCWGTLAMLITALIGTLLGPTM